MPINLYSAPMKYKDQNGNYRDIIGVSGPPGKGIASTELNNDYTLTINYTDDTSQTTPSIKGEDAIEVNLRKSIITIPCTSDGKCADSFICTVYFNATQGNEHLPCVVLPTFNAVTKANYLTMQLWPVQQATSAEDGSFNIAFTKDTDPFEDTVTPNAEQYLLDNLDVQFTFTVKGSIAIKKTLTFIKIRRGENAQFSIGTIASDSSIGDASFTEDSSQTYLNINFPDISSKADKIAPILYDSISMGRVDDSTVGQCSVTLGNNLIASVFGSFAEGTYNTTHAQSSHVEGTGNFIADAGDGYDMEPYPENTGAHAEGVGNSVTDGYGAHAEGYLTIAGGLGAHAEGYETSADGIGAHTEGQGTAVNNDFAHAEGYYTLASAQGSHAEGAQSVASGYGAHAEGGGTIASGYESHAEGYMSEASSDFAHAEGEQTLASGYASHTEGSSTIANGIATHAEGIGTIANGYATHAQGSYNVMHNITFSTWVANTNYEVGDIVIRNEQRFICITPNNDATFNYNNWSYYLGPETQEAFVIGNGISDQNRSNALSIDWDGTAHFGGGIYVDCSDDGTGGTQLIPISDVRINGTSVLSQGVANIPVASANNFGAVKVEQYTAGLYVTSAGYIRVSRASDAYVQAGTNSYAPITPIIQDAATFYGLSKAAGVDLSSETIQDFTYPETAKSAIRTMLGAANSDVIAIQSATPSSADTKIWVSSTNAGSIQVPTVSEMNTALAGKVDDVQIAGSSILSNGVANIPRASSSSLGVVTVGNGLTMINDMFLGVNAATSAQIQAGTQQYRPIVPSLQHESAFYGLAKAAGANMSGISGTTVGVYPDAQKAAIQHMLGTDTNLAPYESDTTADAAYAVGEMFMLNGKLHHATAAIAVGDTLTVGTNCAVVNASEVFPHDVRVNGTSVLADGVANVPVSAEQVYGVIKTNDTYGVYTNASGFLQTSSATSRVVKAGTDTYRTIKPSNQHEAVFYGLAKIAGADAENASNNTITNNVGTYSTTTKRAIQNLIGVESGVSFVETVSGATPSITGEANTRYICGEVTQITITPPSVGTIDVLFTRGSSAAILMVPNSVKFPSWFDATSLEANTIYEIVITDGVYGSVMLWDN